MKLFFYFFIFITINAATLKNKVTESVITRGTLNETNISTIIAENKTNFTTQNDLKGMSGIAIFSLTVLSGFVFLLVLFILFLLKQQFNEDENMNNFSENEEVRLQDNMDQNHIDQEANENEVNPHDEEAQRNHDHLLNKKSLKSCLKLKTNEGVVKKVKWNSVINSVEYYEIGSIINEKSTK